VYQRPSKLCLYTDADTKEERFAIGVD